MKIHLAGKSIRRCNAILADIRQHADQITMWSGFDDSPIVEIEPPSKYMLAYHYIVEAPDELAMVLLMRHQDLNWKDIADEYR